MTVYWRPGCPYCALLRFKLRRSGISVRSVNIWEDLRGAAAVRDIADGNETVPTVTIGDVAMVNPSARRVINELDRRRYRPAQRHDRLLFLADSKSMGSPPEPVRVRLLDRGRRLEVATLAWNMVGIVVLGVAALGAKSVALAGFALDSLIEIGASIVVLWELADVVRQRRRRALQLIGWAFVALAIYLTVQSSFVLVIGYRPHHSVLGIIWTGVTAIVMFGLAAGKVRTGAALDNPVLRTEGRVTMIDGVLATTVLVGLVLNAWLGWWWTDPAAAYVLVYYGIREARLAFVA